MNKDYIQFIQKLSFSFAKYHYDKFIQEHQIEFIEKKDVESYVSEMYSQEKKKELFQFIRKSLKTTLKDAYNPLAVEPILQEINEDDKYARTRIVTEIHDFQKEYYKV
tara:strand:+ start:1822 stop:2145 length:324 start_codon:yes stop_codon:yes gene_type:complete